MYNKRKITKILIVDDSDMNRAILADMLNNQYEILEAKSGIEALKLLHEHETGISLVLLDIQMLVMNGSEATKEIQKSEHPDAKSILILAMTANAFAEDVQASISLICLYAMHRNLNFVD